jgi:hypothetical protein
MEQTNVTVHGFRSTFRDWAAERTEFPREVAEIALSHAVGDKVEAAYRATLLTHKSTHKLRLDLARPGWTRQVDHRESSLCLRWDFMDLRWDFMDLIGRGRMASDYGFGGRPMRSFTKRPERETNRAG